MFRSPLIVTAMLAFAATGCGGSDANKLGATEQTKAKVLTLANAFGGPLLASEQLAQAVARVSEGRLRIEVRSRWRFGEPHAESDLVSDVAAGKADLGWVASRALSHVGMNEFNALQAPLLIDSHDLQERVLSSDVVADMAGRLDSLGVEPVGVLPGPMQYLLTTMPVVTPADLSGHVIGYSSSGYEHGARTLRALGARPRSVPVAAPDYDGLDGAVANTDPLTSTGFHREAKHLAANVPFWPRPLVVFASPRVDSADLELLRRAAIETIPRLRVAEEERDQDQAQAMCRAGVQLHQVDLAVMQRAVRPVYARLLSDVGTRRVVDAIQTMASDTNAPRSVLRCAPASQPPAETLPVGTYEVTITPAEMRAAAGRAPTPKSHGASRSRSRPTSSSIATSLTRRSASRGPTQSFATASSGTGRTATS